MNSFSNLREIKLLLADLRFFTGEQSLNETIPVDLICRLRPKIVRLATDLRLAHPRIWKRAGVSRGHALLFPILVLLLGGSVTPPSLMALSDEETQTFLEEIVFKKTLINNGNFALRWDRQPTFSVIGADARQQEAMDWAVRQLDRPLRPVGFRIRQLGPGVDSADIVVHYMRFAELPPYILKNNLPPKFARMNVVHPVYDENGAIQRAYLFIDSRVVLSDEALPRQALKLILASIGLGGETSLPVQSIFFEVPPGGMGEEPPSRLSSLDVRAIRLVYAYLRPGALPEDLEEAYDQFWNRLL